LAPQSRLFEQIISNKSHKSSLLNGVRYVDEWIAFYGVNIASTDNMNFSASIQFLK